jgi:hypothetical protein
VIILPMFWMKFKDLPLCPPCYFAS